MAALRPADYPSSDGKPMGETDKLRELMAYLIAALKTHFADKQYVYVSGNNFVFEVPSRKTQREDVESKLLRYEQTLQTPECFLFDPTGDYLRPRLQGYRLVDGRYVRLELVNGLLHSEQLGLDLVQNGETLRLLDPAKNRFLPDFLEQAQLAQEEHEARLEAEAEIMRLRAEIEELRK